MPATLPTLFAVALTLGDVTGEPVSIADLTWFDGWVEVNPNLKVRGDAIARALRGEPMRLRAGDMMEADEIRNVIARASDQFKADNELLGSVAEDLALTELERAMNEGGVTEHRLSKEFEISRMSSR
ncbi:hypothetical protein NJ76_21800 [Rhodococcus sp. IITR03]|nr:hypothetical protein NJ76_21800 [Rhodococcus sp. IITR03]